MCTVNYCRQPGQGGNAETARRDLRAELLAAEAAHFAKKDGRQLTTEESKPVKRELEPADNGDDAANEEDFEAKRRRVLEETRDIDADSEDQESESSEEDSDEEDGTAELMRELEKIKRERAEAKAKEVREQSIVYHIPISHFAGSRKSSERAREPRRRHRLRQPTPESKSV